ncbi:MAG: hypothetical protein ACI93H_001846, partial [Psychromonas sp.]
FRAVDLPYWTAINVTKMLIPYYLIGTSQLKCSIA